MKRNKEAALIEDSLCGIAKTGKLLRIIFLLASLLFALFGVLDLWALFCIGFDRAGAAMSLPLIAALVQDLVMLYSLVVCALVSHDASRNITPFTQRQVRRVLSVGWVLLAYTLFCLVLDPIAAQVQYAAGVAAVSLFGSPQPGELFINFETLMAAGAFFLFAYILNYGKTLQELADETA